MITHTFLINTTTNSAVNYTNQSQSDTVTAHWKCVGAALELRRQASTRVCPTL